MILQTATKFYPRVAVYLVFGVALVTLNYFIPRTNFILLFSLYAFLFAAYVHILFYWRDERLIREASAVSIGLRALLLFSIPNLSDDFYRFVWDGNLIASGINPYLFTPYQIINDHVITGESSETIYQFLNSKTYYSVYPPVCQFLFFIASVLSGNSFLANIVLLKGTILLAETGTIHFLGKVIRHQNLPSKYILLYALNPLIILELTGNLHFEAVMIFFLVTAIYFLLRKKYFFSAILFGFAVATKFWPLMLLPFFVRHAGLKKSITYGLTALITTVLLFIPFYDYHIIDNLQNSINLYFTSFEFNSSMYYFLKWITGFDYEIKLIVQKILPSVIFISIIALSVFHKKERIFHYFLFAFCIYFFFSTTVHPWYIAPLILFSVLSPYKFPVVWSFLIFLTYKTYSNIGFREDYFLIILEYVLLISFAAYEMLKQRSVALQSK